MHQVPALKVLLLLLSAVIATPTAQAFNCCRAADVTDDGIVDMADLDEIIACMDQPSPRKDLDGDGTVDVDDLMLVESFMGVNCAEFCRADLNLDEIVDGDDLIMLEGFLGQVCSDLPMCLPKVDCPRRRCQAADLNRNDTVENDDRWHLLAEWGPCPGSSALSRVRGVPPNPLCGGPVRAEP